MAKIITKENLKQLDSLRPNETIDVLVQYQPPTLPNGAERREFSNACQSYMARITKSYEEMGVKYTLLEFVCSVHVTLDQQHVQAFKEYAQKTNDIDLIIVGDAPMEFTR